MAERGMKAKDLEPIIGSKGHISSILSGRREITLKMAQRLKDYFQLPAEVFLRTVLFRLCNWSQLNKGAQNFLKSFEDDIVDATQGNL